MRIEDCAALDHELRRLLGLAVAPIAIGFAAAAPQGLRARRRSGRPRLPMAEPAPSPRAAFSG